MKAKNNNRAAEHPKGEECLWVQVGAFGSMDNARGAEQRLEDAGETAVVIEGPGGLHRVRLGPFDNEKDAVKALERIVADWPDRQSRSLRVVRGALLSLERRLRAARWEGMPGTQGIKFF